jgi:hypothetical protein
MRGVEIILIYLAFEALSLITTQKNIIAILLHILRF